jgi:hypothetical protein
MSAATRRIEELIARSSLGGPAIRTGSVIISGSRHLHVTHAQISDGLDALTDEFGIVCSEVVSGCARGVDRGGESYAAACGDLPIKRFPITQQDWRTYGKSAGPRRNMHMAQYADAALLFWDGQSRGTKDMLEQMQGRRKPFRVVRIGGAP